MDSCIHTKSKRAKQSKEVNESGDEEEGVKEEPEEAGKWEICKQERRAALVEELLVENSKGMRAVGGCR